MNVQSVRGSFSVAPMPYRTGPRHPKLRLWVKPDGKPSQMYETTDMSLDHALREGRTIARRAMVEVK